MLASETACFHFVSFNGFVSNFYDILINGNWFPCVKTNFIMWAINFRPKICSCVKSVFENGLLSIPASALLDYLSIFFAKVRNIRPYNFT